VRKDRLPRGGGVKWADGTGKVVRSRQLEDCLWIYRIEANPGMPRGGILPPAPVLAPGSALGSRPRVALSSAQAPPVYSALRPPGNPGPGGRLAGRGRGIRPGSCAWARSLSKGPCPREAWRRGAGFDALRLQIFILLSFFSKEDCPRADRGHLRPPICPATFRKLSSRPCGERPA
jgi:hypothetical protein